MSRKKKQKQLSKEEYVENYCAEKRIRGRYAVYVSKEAHDNLRKTAGLFKSEYHTTTSFLAEAIINQHFEANRELLNDVSRKEWDQFFEELRKGRSEMEEEEDYEDDLPPA